MTLSSTRLDRRTFIAFGIAAAASTAVCAGQGFFKRHGLPIGIQIYTLGPEALKNLDGSMQALRDMGYQSIELAYVQDPAAARRALTESGLKCTSTHAFLTGDLSKVADTAHAIGAKTVVTWILKPDQLSASSRDPNGWRTIVDSITLDDYRRHAEELNHWGETLRREGLRVAYHNHNFEFAPQEDTRGIDVLLQRTDPKLVTFELDIGWAAAGGEDVARFLTSHRGRFGLAHVKDLKSSTKTNFHVEMDSTEVGSGIVDWYRVLPAAYAAGIREFYVEQEAPFAIPRLQAAKVDYDFLAGISA